MGFLFQWTYHDGARNLTQSMLKAHVQCRQNHRCIWWNQKPCATNHDLERHHFHHKSSYKRLRTNSQEFRLRSSILHLLQETMADSNLNGCCYVVNLSDGNLLIEVTVSETHAEALEQFNKLIRMSSFGRWKEAYLEGKDRAGEFIDVYCVHYFEWN